MIGPELEIAPWTWLAFAGLLVALLLVDLVAHRAGRADSGARALAWSAGWVAVACAFGLSVLAWFGSDAAEAWFGAYLLEKSLSIDNLFVFLVIFGRLKIPRTEERRVLFWGIFGALVLRALFIGAGAALVHRFHRIAYLFGAVLVVTAVRLLRPESSASHARLLDRLERLLPFTPRLDGGRFFLRERGRTVVTPLFVALVAVEFTDVVFAVDSIPAAFAVTTDPFLVYTSNVFALLGLRSLYAVLARHLVELEYLRFGLAAVLGFAAFKMFASGLVAVPTWLSLVVIVVCIGASAIASVVVRRQRPSV